MVRNSRAAGGFAVRAPGYRRIVVGAWLVALLLVSGSAAGPSPSGTAPPAAGGTGGTFLQGTAAWDIELVREFIKKEQGVDIGTSPPSYPNRNMTQQLNQEFAKRIDALMAIYKAHGGDVNPRVVQDLGIVARTGGFRTHAEQIDHYKKCRRIKKGPDGRPVGDGSQKNHWEVVPAAERVGLGTRSADYERRVVTGQEGEEITVYVPRATRAQPNCEVFGVQWDYARQAWVEVMGTVTQSWVGWHNYGLAVDFGQNINQGGQRVLGLPDDGAKAWNAMTNAAGDLGMISGRWWNCKVFCDPPHVEWHPRLHDASTVPGGPTSAAIPDSLVNAEYAWKIPDKIYTYSQDPNNPHRDALTVLELVRCDAWICAKSRRILAGPQTADWQGDWWTYDPPIRLFPAYIPAIRLVRDEKRWPEDSQWGGKTSVTQRFYLRHTTGRQNGESRSVLHYYHGEFRIDDWQKKAHLRIEKDRADKAPYVNVRDASVYEIDIYVTERSGAGAARETISSRSQTVDANGFTREESGTRKGQLPHRIWLHLVWNRDNGRIGLQMVQTGRSGVYDIQDRAGVLTVGTQMPQGAWDMPAPPGWVTPNPRPRPTSSFNWRP